MKRILFVDDEKNVLDGLRRMLRPMRKEWHMAFADNGNSALTLMSEEPYDVVVSDMRMPGMNGAQLLDEIRVRFPRVVRIVLSGQADRDKIVSTVDPVHQYLAKPCESETLKETINRAFALHALLGADRLKRLVSRINSLPSLPQHYQELMQEMRNPEASIEKIEAIVSKDMGMCAKMLQMVNSAFFGLRQKITNPGRAVMFLGLETIRGLALSTNVFSQFKQSGLRACRLETLWEHSMAVGGAARKIASLECDDKEAVDHAFTAGMLHDVGRLILASELPREYEMVQLAVRQKKMSLNQAEYQIMGATHAEVGAYLLGLWGLPTAVLEGVAFHHQPSRTQAVGLNPALIIHVADCLVRQYFDLKDDLPPAELDEHAVEKAEKLESLPVWRRAVQSLAEAAKSGDVLH